MSVNLGELSLPELLDLLRQVADEIEIREMQTAGEAQT